MNQLGYALVIIVVTVQLCALVYCLKLGLRKRQKFAGMAKTAWLLMACALFGLFGLFVRDVAPLVSEGLFLTSDWPDNFNIWVSLAISSCLLVGLAMIDRCTSKRERDLIDQLNMFNALTDSMPQLSWVCRQDGAAIYFNERWEEQIGDRDECLGWSWEKHVHPEDKAPCLDSWTLALQTGTSYEHKMRLMCRNGNYRWFLCRAYPVKDKKGEVLQWFGTSTDIDDYMRDREELFT